MMDLARHIIETQPILTAFLAIGLGYLVGQISIGGFSLGVGVVPQSTVRVETKDATSVVKLIEALEELDDVQSVYANYDIPDEVLEAISAA